jgi:hypothetical protein
VFEISSAFWSQLKALCKLSVDEIQVFLNKINFFTISSIDCAIVKG